MESVKRFTMANFFENRGRKRRGPRSAGTKGGWSDLHVATINLRHRSHSASSAGPNSTGRFGHNGRKIADTTDRIAAWIANSLILLRK